MAYDDLSAFMAAIDKCGQLHRVTVEVDPVLEIAEITNRVCKMDGGPALLFERVQGSHTPVVTNLFGSYQRMAQALGLADLSALTPWLDNLLADSPSLVHILADERWRPKVVSAPPCQQLVERDLDLSFLPLLQAWPQDGLPAQTGRFITLPLVVTSDISGRRTNCGIYLLQVTGPKELAICWRDGSGGARHLEVYKQSGKPMPVAVALGGDPALYVAAAMSLPSEADEFRFAGLLRHEPLAVAPCVTVPLNIPAHAEIVVEGYVDPLAGEVTAGAFGNHTGYYRKPMSAAKLNVTCITRRRQPIYPATIVGPPPMEDCYLAKACERLLVPMLRREVTGVRELNLPIPWIFQPGAIVSIHKENVGDGKRILQMLRGTSALKSAKFLAVVDEDIDPADEKMVAWQLINNAAPEHDLFFFENPGGIGVDGTRKLAGEPGFEQREPLRMDGGISRLVTQRWREYGFA